MTLRGEVIGQETTGDFVKVAGQVKHQGLGGYFLTSFEVPLHQAPAFVVGRIFTLTVEPRREKRAR